MTGMTTSATATLSPAVDTSKTFLLAAERLFARIDGDTSAPKHVVLAPELVIRGSGEIRP